MRPVTLACAALWLACAVPAASAACPADLNGDHVVDLADLATLLSHFGAAGATPADGDVDDNGVVDLSDLALLLGHFGDACPPAPPDLVAGYPFDEGAGTLAADISGNQLDGTLTNGPSWAAGRYGAAVRLDGTNDYVALGNDELLRFTGSLTISAWINSASFPFDDAAVASKRGSSIGYQLDTTIDRGPRTIGWKLTSNSGGEMYRYGASAMQTNQWYHIAGVYNAAARTLDVYLNGQLDNGDLIGTIASAQQDSSEDVKLGRRSGASGFEFAGLLDDVRLYGRALTQAEIQYDMSNPLDTLPGDSQPPDVAITSPANNATVSDIITITADADDNAGVAGVQFLVDGAEVGPEDVDPPYGFSWDTRTIGNGAHQLTARARDAAWNTRTSAPIAVNVANTNYFQNEILATGFELPTNIEFLPDGRMLVAELQGTVKILPPPYTQPDPTPFLQLTNVGSAGVQQGIMDIALDPAFNANRYYYVFYTAGSPNRDRVSRFTASAALNGTVPGSEVVLYQDPQDANSEHHGGALNFGNDGKLYITTGEHFYPPDAQLLSSYRGKILRINPDGTIPPDNPFVDGPGPNRDEIWALGLRNPFRAYYDAPSGRFYVADVGGNDYSTAREEVNVGAAGANYGWPDCEGPCGAPYTGSIYDYPHNGRDASITGGFVYRGTQFPSGYQGSYFFADYTQNWIRRLTFDANGAVNGVFNFEPADGSVDGPYGDIVYLTEGPDGALYYVDLGYSDIGGQFGVSKIRRIRYIQSNLPPVAVATADPVSGPTPLEVSFSSAGSFDPEQQPITFLWTFGDGFTSTEENPLHTYAQVGQYTARLAVSDAVNTTFATPIFVTAGNPPVATILTPANGQLFRAGDVISFSGSATDTEDGNLPPAGLTWNIDFLHEGHVHPGLPIVGVSSGSFTIPVSGHDFSGNTRYRVTLTATDSDGLQSSHSVTVFPDKVNLTFDTLPSGLTLYLDGIATVTPFIHDSLIGFQHNVEARDQSDGAMVYSFLSWSDGGNRQHTIVVPPVAQNYVATYDGQPSPLPAGLVAGWSFDEGSGTSVGDTSPNGNTGALLGGVSWTTGTYGSGISLNGSNGYLQVPNSPSLDFSGAGLTIAMWINPQPQHSGDTVILGKFWLPTMTSPFYQYGIELNNGGDQPRLYLGGPSGYLTATLDGSLPTGQWSHLAVTFDGSQARFYVDGVLVNSEPLSATITARGQAMNLGADISPSQFYRGLLDEVQIYSRALSAAEVLTVKNTPLGP